MGQKCNYKCNDKLITDLITCRCLYIYCIYIYIYIYIRAVNRLKKNNRD